MADGSLVASFEDPNSDNPFTRLSSCSPPESGVTQNNSAGLDFTMDFSFKWTAPSVETGAVSFFYTTVASRDVYWVDEQSAVIQEGGEIIFAVYCDYLDICTSRRVLFHC